MAEEQQVFRCETCGAFSYTLEGLLNHDCPNSVGVPLHIDGLPKQADNQANTEVLLDRWEDKDVHLLISSYSENKHMFNNRGKRTKKEIFKNIADAFNSMSDKAVTADQCLRKWAKLEGKYKEVEDHNKKTGNERKTWKFLKEINNCLESNPKINPAYTIESSGSNSRTPTPSEDLSDTTDSSDERERKVKHPTRKRKSKSSAAEMLVFLQSYAERREKTEAEKLELLRSMQDEKKEFFSQFLDVLRQK